MSCVFCKIITGEIPSSKLYEDDLVYSFLDVAPINPGHSLIIPKEHHTSMTTVPEKTLAKIMSLAPVIAQAIVREVDGDGFNLHLSNGQCAGQVVPHVHLHIIPRSPTDGFSWGWRCVGFASEKDRHELHRSVLSRLNRKLSE